MAHTLHLTERLREALCPSPVKIWDGQVRSPVGASLATPRSLWEGSCDLSTDGVHQVLSALQGRATMSIYTLAPMTSKLQKSI